LAEADRQPLLLRGVTTAQTIGFFALIAPACVLLRSSLGC
jgi:hypothetical protein